MTQACALSAAVLLGGCYLMHERPGAVERDAGTPDARLPAVDGWVDDPPVVRPDAGGECEPRPPVEGRGEPGGCAGPVPPGGTTRAFMGAHVGLSVYTDGCDVWAVSAASGAAAGSGEGHLWRLGRDGIWQDLGGTGMTGRRSHVAMGREGELHILVETPGAILHRVYYAGETFGGMRVLADEGGPRLSVPEPLVHRVSAPVGSGRLLLVYRTDDPPAIWIADLTAGGPPRALFGPTDAALSMPRVCRAGAERVVIVWSQDGRAMSAVSDDGGEGFHLSPVGYADDAASGATLVDVDCHPDGRALAFWIEDHVARTAWLDREGCWHDGDRLRVEGDAFYPHVWISGERALTSWRVRGGATYGTALTSVEGRRLSGPIVGPDADGDGNPDRHLLACARDDGFAVLTQAAPLAEGSPSSAHLAVLSAEGRVERTINLGPYGSEPLDLGMVCDRHGRATVVFLDGQAMAQSWTPSI